MNKLIDSKTFFLKAACYSAAFLFLTLRSVHSENKAEIKLKTQNSNETETFDRNVDKVALASQQNAIQKIKTLLQRYKGKHQEPALLARLGELYQQGADIQFRISHGAAIQNKQTLEIQTHHSFLKNAISTYSELITKYPHYDDLAIVLFKRGKSYEELGEKTKAAQDYTQLISRYPDLPETISAYMSLAEFRIEANDHAQAIHFLEKVEKRPETPQYPFALFKLSWSHYNLKNIPKAMSYVEQHVAYYNALLKSNSGNTFLSSSDLALRENMLLDATLFYLAGYEGKLEKYSIEQALPYFRKLEPGPLLGRMFVRFSKLLRSHGHEKDLAYLKDEVLKAESNRPESLEVLIITFENQVNKRRFNELAQTASQMIPLYQKHPKYEQFSQAQKLLLDTADNIQSLVIKNKNADGVVELSKTLAAIYDSFTKIVSEDDLRIPRVHYNLAETLFQIKQFDQSTFHYRWVVAYIKKIGKLPANQKELSDSSLKAISSRYEELKIKKFIPSDLKAVSLKKNSERELDLQLAEWLAWIDTYTSETKDPIDQFSFEAARALYAQSLLLDALERLKKIAFKRSETAFGVPAASLALDTLIATEDWQTTHEFSKDLLKVKNWKDKEFNKKIYTVAADSAFKLIEQQMEAKKYADVVDSTDDFIKDYSKSERLSDALTLAGNASLELKDRSKAEFYFSKLIHESPQATTFAHALSARSQIYEEKYQFLLAAKDIKTFIDLPRSKTKLSDSDHQKLSLKALTLVALSGDSNELKKTLSNKSICSEKHLLECEKYLALTWLELAKEKKLNKEELQTVFDKARKDSEKTIRTLWAAVGLEAAETFPFRDRLVLIRQLANGYNELDPSIKYVLLPSITRTLPLAFRLNRNQMGEVAPLRADERYITRRIEVIREMENAATKTIKLQWSRIRTLVLNEISDLYLDLAKALNKIPPPKTLAENELPTYQEMIRNIVIPFEEKGQEMRAKAFEIASHFSIEEEAAKEVIEPFFRDNPAQANKLKNERESIKLGSDFKPTRLDLTFLDRLDPKGDWPSGNKDPHLIQSKDKSELLKLHLSWAIKNQKWGQVAFFLQEAKEQSLLVPASLSSVRSIAFAAAGAQAEALQELEDHFTTFEAGMSGRALVALVGFYISSYSKTHAESLLKKVESNDEVLASSVRQRLGWEPQIERKPASTDKKPNKNK